MNAGTDWVIVKLGGSYAASRQLRRWIEVVESCAGQVVVVPGGGPFADAVRTAQMAMGFDDRTAHHMALLAMDQYGCAIASLGTRCKPAVSAAQMHAVALEGGVPIWSPVPMALAASELPASWQLTSDSLAAWLAGVLGSTRVLLIKRSRPSAAPSPERLAAEGAVDPLFPRFLRASGAAAHMVGPEDIGSAAAAIRAGNMPGLRLSFSEIAAAHG
jgi:5-(aminomethyl)-3-furanmethanol phosphate kinase